MTYTEREAKGKWCPMARYGDFRGYDGGEPYAVTNAPGEVRCIASACMMWRWDNDDTRCCKQNGEGLENYKGYCGLAGRAA